VSAPLPLQLFYAALFLGLIIAGAIAIGQDWADYVVYGAFFLTFIGFAIAVNKRQYPTKKRRVVRDSEKDW
jgi:4-hydroxybenzoate polyprenyltransferase